MLGGQFIAFFHAYPVALQEVEQEGFGLQLGKIQPQTFVMATAEGDPLIKVFLVFCPVVTETFRIKAERLAPVFFHVMGVQGGDVHQRIFRQYVALVFHLFHRTARESGERGAHTQCFAEYPAGFFQFAQIIIIQRGFAQALHFFYQDFLPLGVFGEHVDDRAQGAGGGVVGGEQQEDHVVHHVPIGQAAFFIRRLTQFAEEIRGVAVAFLRDQTGDKVFQIAAPFHAPVPQQAGDFQPDHGQ